MKAHYLLCVGIRRGGVWTIHALGGATTSTKLKEEAMGSRDRRDRAILRAAFETLGPALPLCADALLGDAVALRRWLRWRIAALEQPKPTPPLADPFPRSDGAGGAGIPPSPRPAHITKSEE